MGKINTTNYPNRPVSAYQDDDMFILQDNGGETYTTNVGDIKTLIDNRVNDSNLVHKTGDETILGNKTFEDDINVEGGITAGTTSTFNDIELDGSSIYGVGTLNVNQIDVHDGQAVEFLTDVLVNGAVTDEDGNVLSNKADKVTNATSGHLAGLDSNGNLTDSGVSPTEDVTVEGNPVTFDSPFEQDAKSVVVSVKPIQAGSGTPSPENIRPISGIDEVEIGVSGKNQLNYADFHRIDPDTQIQNNQWAVWDNYIACKENETVTVNCGIGNVTIYRFFARCYDAQKNFIGQVTATYIPSNNYTFTINVPGAKYFRFQLYHSSSLADYDFSHAQLEHGSTPTAFEPYNPNSHTTTIPLPSTLYGGDVDVTEGSATEDDGLIVFDGSENWVASSSVGTYYLTTDSTNFPYKFASNIMAKSEQYGFDGTKSTSYSNMDNGKFCLYYNEQSQMLAIREIAFKNTNITTLQEWKAALSASPLRVIYELATPTTISFTPADVELLEGTNVVTTNGEKVAVTYGRSLWQDIDELKTDTEGKLNKSDVATIEGDTASKAYSVNDFMLRSDGLYKVTQPIAQNASITASNTTKTTIGAVLTALLNA